MLSFKKNANLPLPLQPCDDEGPLFREPWEAQAFALTIQLNEDGIFTWAEWTKALSLEITAAKNHGEDDCGDTYYHYWLKALEKLVIQKGIYTTEAIDARVDSWRRSYLATPHGQPVELDAD